MEHSFLVDVNLPKNFHYFNHENFRFVIDLNPFWSDQEIWDYALKHKLVILTKDTDFYNRFITSDKSPKIVYFQLGNQTLHELHTYFLDNWKNLLEALNYANLIIASRQELRIIY